MTDNEKLEVLKQLSNYVHDINNCVTALDFILVKLNGHPKYMTILQKELDHIRQTGVEIRLNLIQLFEKGDENVRTISTNGDEGSSSKIP